MDSGTIVNLGAVTATLSLLDDENWQIRGKHRDVELVSVETVYRDTKKGQFTRSDVMMFLKKQIRNENDESDEIVPEPSGRFVE